VCSLKLIYKDRHSILLVNQILKILDGRLYGQPGESDRSWRAASCLLLSTPSVLYWDIVQCLVRTTGLCVWLTCTGRLFYCGTVIMVSIILKAEKPQKWCIYNYSIQTTFKGQWYFLAMSQHRPLTNVKCYVRFKFTE